MTPDEVKRIRKRLRLTQAELAKELGVTRVSVARWEVGIYAVPEMAARLLEHLVKERRGPPQKS
jgi:DNA-binding transcriptional regulator YiaG